MSSISTTNISSQNISGNCNLKCAYSFNYQNSSTTATNGGFSINLTYDKANVPPVTYNANNYEVDTIMLVTPSYHNFNGAQLPAELIIIHKQVVSGPPLIVSVPIVSSVSTNAASVMLTEIITAVSAGAPAQGESTKINISDFNLNAFVPSKKPLYSYTNTSDPTNWILFGKENAITLSQDILNTLAKIIKPYPIYPTTSPTIFYNSAGANLGSVDNNQIYIKCKPVSSSGDDIEVVNDIIKSPVSFDLNNPVTIMILQIIVGCIIFFLIIFGIHRGLKYISGETIKISTSGKS